MTTDRPFQGLALARKFEADRTARGRQLSAAGRRVFGYTCCYAPLELMTALEITPLRILGDMDEPITLGDAHLPSVMCIFYRSCLDLALKGRYDFLDGFVGTHACDCAQRVGQMWRDLNPSRYDFFLDIPHTLRGTAVAFFKRQMEYFKQSLEAYTGQALDDERLRQAIALHNRQRALVRRLYDLRKPDPPLITGTETLQVIGALMALPVSEGIDLLRDVIAEIQQRPDKPPRKVGRLMVWGSLIDHTSLTRLAEAAGLHIVIDDTALGTRSFFIDVPEDDEPLNALARHYLESIYCPRTYKPSEGDYPAGLHQRFGYLRDLIEAWRVNGVYLNLIRNCDCHGYEIPAVTDYLKSIGLPVLPIEHSYSTAALEPLRTRFQAFAEILE